MYKKVISEKELDAGLRLLNTIRFRRRFKFTKEVFFEITDLPEMERRLEDGHIEKCNKPFL